MREFKKIGVVGSGTMGHGIAQTFAAHGYETVVIDVKEVPFIWILIVIGIASLILAIITQLMQFFQFIARAHN